MESVIITPRLFLREMNMDDYEALYAVLADTSIMQHYPYTFDEERVKAWIERNMNRYKDNGFGLQQHKGYAKEAAAAVRDWAFMNTGYPALYSYCKYTNVGSYKTAESIGMVFEKEYPDKDNEITHVSVIRREMWSKD